MLTSVRLTTWHKLLCVGCVEQIFSCLIQLSRPFWDMEFHFNVEFGLAARSESIWLWFVAPSCVLAAQLLRSRWDKFLSPTLGLNKPFDIAHSFHRHLELVILYKPKSPGRLIVFPLLQGRKCLKATKTMRSGSLSRKKIMYSGSSNS